MRLSGVGGELREDPAPEFELDIAARRNLSGASDRVRHVLKPLAHLMLCHEREILVLVPALLAVLDAPHDLRRFAIVRSEVIDVVLRDYGYAALLAERFDLPHLIRMTRDLGVMRDFEKEIVFPEDALILREGCCRCLIVPGGEELPDVARK